MTTAGSLPMRLLILSLLFVPAVCLAEMPCADFLTKLGKKPQSVEFLGCKSNTTLQGSPLEANYKVPGPSAATAEKYLVKRFRLKKLRRNCCLWESVANFYRDKNGTGYTIDMATEETPFNRRNRWREIPYFYIRVHAYSEDP